MLVVGLAVLDYDDFESGRFFYSSDRARQGYPVTLIILSSLTAGSTYEFQLDASHSDSDARATVTVTVNAPPACSALAVSRTQYHTCYCNS